jgi:hypothetical protein
MKLEKVGMVSLMGTYNPVVHTIYLTEGIDFKDFIVFRKRTSVLIR